LEKTKRDITRQLRRARTETVTTARDWNKAAFADALRQGVSDTNAALADPKVVAALRAAASDEEPPPWNK
jgi:hypothetical protein